jgi:hypothetical protein
VRTTALRYHRDQHVATIGRPGRQAGA